LSSFAIAGVASSAITETAAPSAFVTFIENPHHNTEKDDGLLTVLADPLRAKLYHSNDGSQTGARTDGRNKHK